jgi:hypothetical protein
MKVLLGALAIASAAAGFVAVSIAPASALTCSIGNVAYALDTATAVLCGSGNPDYSVGPGGLAAETFFGIEYYLADKTDGPDGTGLITFTDPPTSGESSPGTWVISDPTGIASQVVIVLKQANSFAAFLISGISGTWTTAGPGGSTMALSHGDVWYKPSETEVIPLPASLPLLLGGLAGLGVIGRMRKRKAV